MLKFVLKTEESGQQRKWKEIGQRFEQGKGKRGKKKKGDGKKFRRGACHISSQLGMK